MAETQQFDALIALGAVIRGETYHFEIVAGESARGIMALTMDGVPIGNGILTVENEQQAIVRADPGQKDKGGEAAKAALAMLALKERGIGYRHLRALGTPPSLRKAYRLDHDFGLLTRGYHAHLATQGEALEDLGALAAQERVCLLCYEADPGACHRSLIAGRLQALGMVGDAVNLRVA